MLGFGFEIDHDLIEQQIPFRHLPESQLLWRQNEPGRNGSNCSAALFVSFPDSTSFSNSASIRGRSPYEKGSDAREKIGGAPGVSDCGFSRNMKPLPPVSTSIWFWITFHTGVFIALAVDLASFKRRHRALSMRAATLRSLLWVVLSLGFSLVVAQTQGSDRALDFLTGYLVEYSVSVDNIFVFVLIFAYFKVPPISQHRVLVWGIMGALVMRGLMIWLGVSLVSSFHFILYVFGVFLVITGIRMGFSEQQTDFGDSWFLRMCRKLMPVTHDFRGSHFTARIDGRLMLTPLALVLLVIDVMDLVFAVDSIPAVFAITQDTFIVYTSNICAILGLRSLYFLLANLMNRFVYLRSGLSVILVFVGVKMTLSTLFPIPNYISLVVIVAGLAVTICASIFMTRNQPTSDPRK